MAVCFLQPTALVTLWMTVRARNIFVLFPNPPKHPEGHGKAARYYLLEWPQSQSYIWDYFLYWSQQSYFAFTFPKPWLQTSQFPLSSGAHRPALTVQQSGRVGRELGMRPPDLRAPLFPSGSSPLQPYLSMSAWTSPSSPVSLQLSRTSCQPPLLPPSLVLNPWL